MPGTQVVPNQAEENIVLPELYLSSLADYNENNSKEKLIIHLKVLILSGTGLTPWQSHISSKDLKSTLTPQSNLKEMEEKIKDFNYNI